MLSVLVDNSVIKTRADKPSDKERIEMKSFLEKAERDSKNSDVEPLYECEREKVVQPKKNTRCVATGICLAVVIVGVIASVCLLAYKLSTLGYGNNKDDEQNTVLISHSVSTTNGYIHGLIEDGVHVFKGIPYAVPPVGSYRWKPPVPLNHTPESSSTDVFEANQFSSKCFQYQEYYKNFIGSEDCLYLNVWSPNLDPAAKLNVMVFIHGGGTETDKAQLFGGGLLSGSGHESGVMPDAEIAKTANMVFVSFNYRLGPFGFLAVNVSDPDTGHKVTGNYGFMDQTLVLKWVQKNIKNFGGDANKVTVFGLGAGATSIFALLASDKAQGLFQRAWLASPSPNFDTNLSAAFQQNHNILNKLRSEQCSSVSSSQLFTCLQAVDPEDILNALPINKWSNPHFRDLPSSDEHPTALAIIDGSFLKQQISKTWHSGKGSFKNVSMLIGSASQEVDDWPYWPNISRWSWKQYNAYVKEKFESFKYVIGLSGNATRLYPPLTGTPEYQLTSMISDIRQICGVSHMTKLIGARWNAPVYRYVAAPNNTVTNVESPAEWQNDVTDGDQPDPHSRTPSCKYACHGIDVRYFFSEVEHFKQDEGFINNIRTAVFEFARTGAIKVWPRYVAPQFTTSVVSSQVEYFNNFKREQCQLWLNSFFLPAHAWMN